MASESKHCCGTCRHWNSAHETVQPITCMRLSDKDVPHTPEGAILFASPVPGARVKTGGSFACSLYQARGD